MKAKTLCGLVLITLWCLTGPSALFSEPGETSNMVIKSYEVLDLVIETPNFMGGNIIGIAPLNAGQLMIPTPFCSSEDLNQMIQLLDENWGEGKACEFQAPNFIICNTPEVHKRVETLLAYLRQLKNRTITIETKMLILDNASWEGLKERVPANLVIDDKLLSTMLEKGEPYKTAQKTAYNGQQVYIKDRVSTTFTRAYEMINSGPDKVIGDPQISVVEEGILLNIRPFITPAGNEVLVDINLETNALLSIEQFDTKLTDSANRSLLVDLPRTELTELNNTLRISDKTTVLAGAVNIKGTTKSLITLITPTISEPADKKSVISEIPLPGGNSFKLIEVGTLTCQLANSESSFSRALNIPYTLASGQQMYLPTSINLPNPPAINFDALISRLQSHTSGIDWQKPGAGIMKAGATMAGFIQSPDNIKKAMDLVNAFPPPRMVKVETTLLELTDAYWQALNTDNKKEGFINLNPQTVKEILNETAKGERARLLTNAEVTGLNTQLVTIGQGQLKNYIRDIDAASGATLFVPVVDTIGQGTSLSSYPVINGNNIAVFINFTYTDLLKMEVEQREKGCYHKPQTKTQSFVGNVNLPDNGWAIGGITSSKDTATGKLKYTVILIHANIVK